MAQAAFNVDPRSAADAREHTLTKFEALSEAADAVASQRKAHGHIRRALKAWRRGDFARTAELALKAVQEDDTNAYACHILAMGLERMGHLREALAAYERAYQLDPANTDLLLDLGLSASNLEMTEWAETMFRHYIASVPDSPLGYNNLGSLQCKSGRIDEGIETLRAAIYRMPDKAILWNTLATALAEEGRCEESLIFYSEALRLDDSYPRALHNLGFAYAHLGRLEEAMACYEKALTRVISDRERLETLHSRSLCRIGMGQLEEGFREYEVRYDPKFRTQSHIIVKAPRWNGEDLSGKRLLVTAEQGLGDELMFANIIPDLVRAVGDSGKLQIAVDARLVPLFQRSFPAADVGAYEDRKLERNDNIFELRFVPWAVKDGEPDFHVSMGSALRFLRPTLESFPGEAFLKPDPARVADFRKQLEALGPGPYVGICWRSMLLEGKRHKYYSALDDWRPVLQTPGVTFVNVQYGDCADELARAQERQGVTIHSIGGLDLKNDLDGAAALSAALDLVISAPTAAAATAASVGTEVWFLTAGRTWPQLGTDKFPWYRATRVFSPEKFGDWLSLMPSVSESLSALASG
jgi:tetratricopeptide (TPR) repeat protein